MRRWVKAKKRNVYHFVINDYYICNKAMGKINTKEARPIPSSRYCCKNCLRKVREL